VYATLGAQFVGPNNPYNQAAFGILSSHVRVPIDQRTAVEINGFNLTGAYGAPYETAFGGVPVPLVNGKLGAIDGGNVGPPRFSLLIRRTLW
jgi:hypothetical protein